MLGVGAGGPVAATAPAPDPGDPVARPVDECLPRSVRPRGLSARERDAWAVLAAVDGLGPVGLAALLRTHGSAEAVVELAHARYGTASLAETPMGEAPDDERPRRLGSVVAQAVVDGVGRAEATLRRVETLGLRVVTSADEAYPRRLAAIDMPPPVLFVLGDPGALDPPAAVAVVGTRRATDAGRTLAARLASSLVAAGATVISGLATGIDGSAHAATLRAGGRTVAVIGSGHAALFPRVHQRLAASIASGGGAIVSELPPDIGATRGTFPRRNRVISGLADATVVVEAPARSGALITASWALEQGRECFLVPGPIDAPAWAGCLAFLREFGGSARVVSGIPQLIEDLGLAAGPTPADRTAAATLIEVGEAAARIGRELVLGRATVDELVAVTGWPVASVLAALTVLEGHGLAMGVHGRFRPTGRLAMTEPAAVLGRHGRRG